MEDNEETMMAILAATSDIQRWLMNCALKGRISRDRLSDIQNRAKRLLEDAEKLTAEPL